MLDWITDRRSQAIYGHLIILTRSIGSTAKSLASLGLCSILVRLNLIKRRCVANSCVFRFGPLAQLARFARRSGRGTHCVNASRVVLRLRDCVVGCFCLRRIQVVQSDERDGVEDVFFVEKKR